MNETHEHTWEQVGALGVILIYACTECRATREGYRVLDCEGG